MSETAAGREGMRVWLARLLYRLGDAVAPPRRPDECERVMVERIEARGGDATIVLSHSIVKEIAGHLASWFDEAGFNGPGNYVEVQMSAPDGRAFVMTVQRIGRPTPHDLRKIAEDRVRELEAQITAQHTPEQRITEQTDG